MSEKERIAPLHESHHSSYSNGGSHHRDSSNGGTGTNGIRKTTRNGRRNKYQTRNRRHDDEHQDIKDLVNWRTSSSQHRDSKSTTTSFSTSTSSSSTSSSPSRHSKSSSFNYSQQEKKYPPKSHDSYDDTSAKVKATSVAAAKATNYPMNYHKMASYSFSIELTEYDFEEIRSKIHSTNHHSKGHGHHSSHGSSHHGNSSHSNNNSHGNNKIENLLDDELEIYLKAVYAKSEAVLDLHAQHLAIVAERSKQTATERWLLSRTPEERNRYLQSRNMTTQF